MSITINGTTGIAGVDGSATTPAFQGTDTNTGLFYGTDIVGIATGGSERVRVDSSGNVGIGASSPDALLTVNTIASFGDGAVGTPSIAHKGDLNTGFWFPAADTIASSTGGSERMRIDSSGNVFVATTSQIDQGLICASYNGQAKQGIVLKDTNATLNGSYMYFINSSGSLAGQIQHNGTTTVSYVTSSDYRLKENVTPMVNALNKIAKLKPVTYTWKNTNGEQGEGFIAHELAEVCPLAVSGKKDEVNEDGSIKPQGIDTSFLVATLTAAIQEQQTIINDLKARIAVLETK
jgi:hypothetical protein